MTSKEISEMTIDAAAFAVSDGISTRQPDTATIAAAFFMRECAAQLAELNESLAILLAGMIGRRPQPTPAAATGKAAQCDNCGNVFLDPDGVGPVKFADMGALIDGVRAGGWRVLVKVIEENGPQKGHLHVLMFCAAGECQQVGESLFIDGWENGAPLDLGKRLRKRAESVDPSEGFPE